MLHCVPEWDVSGGDLDVVLEPTDLFVPSKGRWEQSRKCNPSETAFVPDFEFEELCWEDGELVVVQGLSSKGSRNRSCLTNASDRLALALEACTSTGIPAADVGGTLDKDVTGGVIDSFANNNCAQEDELMTWMQHLIDDPPEKYGSDVPSESPNPNMWNACDEVFSQDSVHHVVPLNTLNSGHCSTASASRTLRMDVLSNHTSQTTTGEGQGNAFKQTDGVLPGSGIKGSTPCASNSSKTSLEYGPTLRRPQMPPPEVQQVISSSAFVPFLQAGSPSLLNFSNFSRPAAAIKANLHSIGMASGPTGTERLKQLDRVAVGASNCESIESGTKDASLTAAEGQEDAFVSTSSIPRSAGGSSVHHPVQSLSSREEAEPAMSGEDVDGNFKVVDISHGWNSCVTSSAAPGTDRSTAALEAVEPRSPCYSGGSGNTAGKSGKGPGGGGKRKVHDGEDSECQSKDPEDESADDKKPTSGPSDSIKKSRAAEIHNQSERRRRDRINEKMKALQELIPNCNKTDKASLLEEAIEYVKSLQTQLQVMSYRSGMSLSPLVIQQGVQHLQMAQMVPLPHMHMGMGMGLVDMPVGMPGMHILPMPSLSTTPFTCPVMPVPVPTVPPASIPVSAFPISEVSWPGVSPPGHQVLLPVRPATIPGTHEPLHTSNVMSQNLYLTPQQQHPAQVMNKSMYNAFIAYQHQLPQPSNFIMANRPLQ